MAESSMQNLTEQLSKAKISGEGDGGGEGDTSRPVECVDREVGVSVHPVNVGNGDCTLVRITPDKTKPKDIYSVLIDGGYQWQSG